MAVVKEADFHKKDRTGLISRAEVVGKITSSEMQMSYRQMTGTEVYNEILCILNNAHYVDEEPIVRCCECDLWNRISAYKPICACGMWSNDDGYEAYTKADDYCSYGCRKEDTR